MKSAKSTWKSMMIFSLLLLGCFPFVCWATTYYVKPDGNDSAVGTSWETALKTPIGGFSKVSGTDGSHEVVIAAGTYELTGSCACAGPTAASGNRIVIRGATGNPSDVILKGNGTFELIRLSRCVTVAGLTIANGSNANRSNRAAGIRVGYSDDEPGPSIVSNCVVTGCYNAYTNHTKSAENKDMFGGPVYVYSNGLLVDSVVSNNTSVFYGCGVTLDGSNATALRCRIEGNVATNAENSGVAVLGINGDTPYGGRMINCVIQSNRTAYCAGARNVTWVEGCSFLGNVLEPNMQSAHSAPAFTIAAPNVVVTNCTFADNHADAGYSTVNVSETGARILDSRFIGNSVGGYGGAITFAVSASGASTVADCIFANNSVAQSSNKGGGAFRVESGNVNVINCTFTNNAAPYGGAVDIVWGNGAESTRANVAFANCLFIGNSAKECGGGVRVAKGARVSFDDCRIVGNRTTHQLYDDNLGGGGVFLYMMETGGGCVASNCVFASNSSELRCGGLGHTWGGYTFGEVVNCVFTNNTAVLQGGGLVIRENDGHKHNTPFVVRNSLFAFNRTTQGSFDSGADANGAGIHFVSYNKVVLDSCTIVSNDSGYTMSGGVHHRWGGTITNCVIAFNTVKGAPEPATTSAWSMDASCYQNCCIYPGVPEKFLAANGCINADPLFVNQAGSDFSLRPSSPCRNAGLQEDWMIGAFDLAGGPRISGRGVDIGCYELLVPNGLSIVIR